MRTYAAKKILGPCTTFPLVKLRPEGKVALSFKLFLALLFASFLSGPFSFNQAKAQDLPPIRVLAYNTFLIKSPLTLTNDHLERMEELPQALREFDILGLSEVARQNYQDYLSRALQETHPYSARLPMTQWDVLFYPGDLLLLSRFPIITQQGLVYQNTSIIDDFVNKGALFARIKLGEDDFIDVVLTHLQSRKEDRHRRIRLLQLQELAKFIQKHHDPQLPLLIMGDMNIPEHHHSDYQTMLQYLHPAQDLYRSLKQDKGLTYNGEENPLGDINRVERIDYIFLKDEQRKFRPLDARVHKFPASRELLEDEDLPFLSDHYGVEAVLQYVDSQ